MALYYKVTDIEDENISHFERIQVHKGESLPTEGPCIKYDFSKHVLIELLDNVTPESKLWKALGLVQDKNIVHKRLLGDPHRVNCRRAIVVCINSDIAREMATRLTQAKIVNRCVCAVVIQELLSDLRLFEKQIIQYGDKGSQQQLVYVTDLNRPREPKSLAHYLREKFSPFGTILSVFVSEGKDGYALPEGVIRFAHLSEAFAAELAYDQCAVAMERLSVTTHHNILLSQSDLKARLKKAQLQHSTPACGDSNKSNVDVNLCKSSSAVVINLPSHVGRRSMNSSSSSVTSEIPPLEIPANKFQQKESEISDPVEMQDPTQTDSAELADVLKNSCNDNLVDCLKGIATDNESSVSKKTSICTASVVSTSEANEFDQRMHEDSSPSGFTAAVLNLEDKSWSSRVIGWISEIPSADDMPNYNDNWNTGIHSSESDDHQHHSRISHDGHQNGYMQHTMDIASNSGSFVTCRNDDVNASFRSNLSSPVSRDNANNLDNTIMQAGTFSSPEKSRESTAEEIQYENNRPASILLSLNNEDICPVSTSQKRKNSSLMTQKLSLKNQRLDSSQALSEISESEVTIHLPSLCTKECAVVLTRLPELTTSLNAFKPPIAVQDLQSSSNSNAKLPASSRKLRLRTGSTISEASSAACSTKSIRSLPVRRGTRRAKQEQEQKSLVSSRQAGFTKQAESTTAVVSSQVNKLSDEQEETPLRAWLKKELILSTNNQIYESKESTKRNASATGYKDEISVGCSHMVCDFCYPDSVKLLMGCN